MIIDIEGIVIKQVQYKEKDAMVSVLTKDGMVSFLARGIASPTSKNASSCLLFAYSSFTLTSKQDKLTLTQGKLIKSYFCLYESLEKMSALQIIAEGIIKCLDEENGVLYPYLYRFLELIEKDYSSSTLVSICLAQIIKNSGYGLNYESCVNCGSKKDIVTVSYYDGGFLCIKCLENTNQVDSKTYLNSYRYCFMVTPELMDHYVLDENVCMRLIEDFTMYLCDKFGFKEFKSLEIYKTSKK